MNIIISSPLRPDKKQIRGSDFAICRTGYNKFRQLLKQYKKFDSINK
jgi:hypothetical protein